MKYQSVIILTVFLFSGTLLRAQIIIQRTFLLAHIGTMSYQGDLADELGSFTHGIAGGQGIDTYLNKSFDGGFEINFATVHGDNAGPRGNKGVLQCADFRSVLVNIDVMAKFKLANGYMLNEESKISPLLLAGIGGIYSSTSGHNSRRDDFEQSMLTFNFCLGAEIRVMVNSRTGIYARSVVLLPLTDKIDGWYPLIPANEKNDYFMMNSIGVTFVPWL